MPINNEIQSFDNDYISRENDKQANFLIGLILSRKGLAPKVQSLSVAASTPDGGAAIWVISNNINLPFARYWGNGRSPIILARNTLGVAVTLTAQAGDTIEAAASYNLAAGTSAILFTDGSTKWFVK